MIHLEEINADNWREDLAVSREQQSYVSDRFRLLARAYAYRDSRSRAKLICAGDMPVGMLLFYDCDKLGAYDFSQLFIDERYQGRGYGTEAARRLYEKLGFVLTGETDGDEILMCRMLR